MNDFRDDLRSLALRPDLSRRGFAVTSLAAGFALSTRPVAAATITTGTEGLNTGEAKIPVDDGEIPAYYARPEGGGPFPTILVVQEIFGVHEHIRDICRRLAQQGYLAVAAELYARQGNVAAMEDVQAIIRDVVAKVPDAQVMGDLDAAAAWAGTSGRGDTSRLGITGFCWGGRIVWLYAAHNPGLKAGVAWYGRLAGQPSELQPRNPLDLVGEVKCPVLGLYGGADQGIPVESVEAMKAAMAAAGKEADFVVYPDTPHAFNADYRASYREGPAKDGWQRCLTWFKAHGVA